MIYGKGGGGILRWCGLKGENIIVINSLAKGFGVPLSIVAGSKELIDYFKDKSVTRMHCSPPSMVVITAAENALKYNAIMGDFLRSKLAEKVIYFKRNISKISLETRSGFFPFQTVIFPSSIDILKVYNSLLEVGIKTILSKIESENRPQISFIIRVDHSIKDIKQTINLINYILTKATYNFFKPNFSLRKNWVDKNDN